MKKLIGHSLALKQAKTAAIAAVIVGFLFSAAQLGYDFIIEKQNNQKTAHHILNTMSGPASEATYNLSGELAQKVLKGVMENPQVKVATIYALFGSGERELLATLSREKLEGEVGTVTRLLAPAQERYSIDLHEGNTDQLVGMMQIELDPNVLANLFLDRAILVFTAGLLRNISLTFILLFAFYNTLTKPISRLALRIRDLDVENPEQGIIEVPAKHKYDELGLLINGINRSYELLGENLRRRREAEKEIRESMYLFQALARSSSDIFWQTDQNLRINLLTIDEKTDKLNRQLNLGGSNLFEFLEANGEDGQTSLLAKVKDKHSDFRDLRISSELDGAPLHLSFYGTARFDNQGAFIGYLGTAVDITESLQKDREIAKALEQLRQAQKLEAVGQLTGGVAHDFNNLLAVIIGNLEIVEDALMDQPDLQKLISRAIASSEKGAKLTQQLLAFSRKQSLHPQRISTNAVINDLTEILKRTFSTEIDIQTDLSENIGKAFLDPTQLENALLNLAINARDAMQNGGQIRFKTEAYHQEEDHSVGAGFLNKGEYVKISVSDTGSGMSPDVVKKAMEPFFTTKEVGKGSGMGLAMVYGFVGQSNGTIHISSQPGVGTTIELYLPIDADYDNSTPHNLSILTS